MKLGVTVTRDGVHVAVYSRHAKTLYFCLFNGDKEVDRIALKRDGDFHFAQIAGVKTGQQYGLRADGQSDRAKGHCFDVSKLLIDPYAKAIDRHADWHPDLAKFGAETCAIAPKCIVTDDVKLVKPLPPTVPHFIYEVPVRAFTMRHPEVPPEKRGTIAALREPAIIKHLKMIGCDAVELMPIAAWTDERHLAPHGLVNAWGYNPVAMLAPEPKLAPGGSAEVRETVSVLHENGIRVILDVVFNHTGESDYGGATLSLRGLDNASYYRLHNGELVNDTGCGNTLALDQPPAMSLALDAMRHWVNAAGIDGFRYDLAPVMGRTATGFDPTAPMLRAITDDPLLSPLVHIAEPWDVGPGGYQLGAFPPGWLEWNDKYRDDVRKFWRGDPGAAGAFATRLAGSSDIFDTRGRKPSASVNFVAAHDGFTLADTVNFPRKQNFGNGESNRDGSDHEVSWTTHEPAMKIRALLASLFLSRGTVLLTAGDEFGRTQNGNNNAYAQDNDVTWLNWPSRDEKLAGFVAALAKFRKAHPDWFNGEFLTGRDVEGLDVPDAEWFDMSGHTPKWDRDDLQTVGLILAHPQTGRRIAVAFSAEGAIHQITLPPPQKNFDWHGFSECHDVSNHVAMFIEIAE
jgi:glycogen debranching enzyme